MGTVDLKRRFRDYFESSPDQFTLVTLPTFDYVMVDGEGDPNTSRDYAVAIELLYGVSYTLKFKGKKELGVDYVVPPLEGLWWAHDVRAFVAGDKSSWRWTMMIMVPAELPRSFVMSAREAYRDKKPGAPVERVRFESLTEGLVVQILHIGPYDAEGPLLARLHDEFMPDHALIFNGPHHEIYLGDPRRTAPARLRTILRQPVDVTTRAQEGSS
jgi:hypothetical protein